MSKLVPPHGGELIPLLVHEGKQLASLKAASLLTSVDGIHVSNHGGRSEDGGRGAIECLPEVVRVAKK